MEQEGAGIENGKALSYEDVRTGLGADTIRSYLETEFYPAPHSTLAKKTMVYALAYTVGTHAWHVRSTRRFASTGQFVISRGVFDGPHLPMP